MIGNLNLDLPPLAQAAHCRQEEKLQLLPFPPHPHPWFRSCLNREMMVMMMLMMVMVMMVMMVMVRWFRSCLNREMMGIMKIMGSLFAHGGTPAGRACPGQDSRCERRSNTSRPHHQSVSLKEREGGWSSQRGRKVK